jgi:hypothetical protein
MPSLAFLLPRGIVHVLRTTDLDLTPRDITDLASPDALMSFLHRLGYETNGRAALTPEAIGLSGDSAGGGEE